MNKTLHTIFLIQTGQENGQFLNSKGSYYVTRSAAQVVAGLGDITLPTISLYYGGYNRQSAEELSAALRASGANCFDTLHEIGWLAGINASQIAAGSDVATLCKNAGIELLTFLFSLIYGPRPSNTSCVICGEHSLHALAYLTFKDVCVRPDDVFRIQICEIPDLSTAVLQLHVDCNGGQTFSIPIPKTLGHLLADILGLDMSKVAGYYTDHACAAPLVEALRAVSSAE